MSREIKILILIFPGFDLLDLSGPVEVLGKGGTDSIKFNFTIASETDETKSVEGVTIKRDKSFEEVAQCIGQFHVLIQPGAGLDQIKAYRADSPVFEKHLGIIQRFTSLSPSGGESRTLLSICTGALIIGSSGAFSGLEVTTHYEGLELLHDWCELYRKKYGGNPVKIVPDLRSGSKGPEFSHIHEAYRNAQKAQVRWVDAGNNDRGVRVISSGGISCGLDASLFLLSELVNLEKARFSARIMEYAWRWA
ncbi:ThiJ PfpI family protein [Aspergillus sclerotialis]|uniref:ThiJ PfpI family protein n=1 Tax=Aspergillus sclerotialis TaxID=2070753 RepID=A0A3A2ZNK3_9EURO|nr:ThiJ PfpI family protein [Aspergillus sclerotialis]